MEEKNKEETHSTFMSSSNLTLSKNIQKIIKNLGSMLTARGYCTEGHMPPVEELNQKFSKNQIIAFNVPYKDDTKCDILIHFLSESKLGIQNMRYIRDLMLKMNTRHAIIVIAQNVTPFAKTAIDQQQAKEIRIECFKMSELMINITDHIDVPRHVVLSDDEKQYVFDTIDPQPENYPLILRTDPMAKYLGLVPGMMVRIERSGFKNMARTNVKYRICV